MGFRSLVTLIRLLALPGVVGLVASCAGTQMATIISGNSDQCLNFPIEGNPVIGTPARIHACDPFKNQQWNVAKGEISASGNICLTVPDDAVDGTPVVFASCRGAPGQHWSEQENGHIVGIGGKCLDVEGGSAVQWAPVIISTCSDAPTQKWNVQR